MKVFKIKHLPVVEEQTCNCYGNEMRPIQSFITRLPNNLKSTKTHKAEICTFIDTFPN